MRQTTWEMATLDWDLEGLDGQRVTPADVENLLHAETEEQARKAKYVLMDIMSFNGWLYPCAITVVKTVLAVLPRCSRIVREQCLHLLGCAVSAESAPEAGNVSEACLAEIRNATWYFLHGLQFDDVDQVAGYVDILGCLGTAFDDLTDTVEQYLRLALTRDLPHYDVVMTNNTIDDLRKQPAR